MINKVLPQRSYLDAGYLRLVESWGDDRSIIESARMSTAKGFLGWDPNPTVPGHKGDQRLLEYLWNHKHATPFEFCGAIFEIKAPIAVFREWHRHRTQSYTEMSARYVPLPNENYIPSVERLLLNSKTNKQAGTITGAEELTPEAAERYRQRLMDHYALDQELYEEALTMGVPKELARMHLPVGRYSVMRAQANLRNWIAFLTLRCDETAQWEIRQYAHGVADMLWACFPRTLELAGFVPSQQS